METLLVQAVVRYGDVVICRDLESEDGKTVDLNVAQYIAYDLGQDELSLSNPLYNRILDEAVTHSDDEGFKSESYFLNHPDVEISKIAGELSSDSVQLSKSLQKQPSEESLREQVFHLVLDFRMNYVEKQLKILETEMKNSSPEEQVRLMPQLMNLREIRNILAKRLGKNLVYTL